MATQRTTEYSAQTWKWVAEDLLAALDTAMDLPRDVGEMCEVQAARDAVRTLPLASEIASRRVSVR